jgi:hypothetical protein
MSDCDVCIGSSDGGNAEFSETVTRKSRKPFVCCECHRTTPKGDLYEICHMRYEGEWLVYRTCSLCVEIRNVFTCGKGWTFECLWESMRDYAFEKLTTACKCFMKLSPEAKAFTLERWRKWKGLAA